MLYEVITIMTARQARIFYLLVVCLFLLVMLPSLLSDGMFMDGLLYAAIAKNLAHGLGTFWSPHLSGGLFRITSYNVCYTKLLRSNVLPTRKIR